MESDYSGLRVVDVLSLVEMRIHYGIAMAVVRLAGPVYTQGVSVTLAKDDSLSH